MKTKILLIAVVFVQSLFMSWNAECSTPSRHMGNNGRTGYTQATVPAKPVLLWTYEEKHPPRQAWKEPNRELQFIDFDYATQVALGNGLALFGSSADHKVYAVDQSTGKERWHFYTEGPVRFAPVIENDHVYVVSDDGYLYCLNLTDGSLVWKFRGGPTDGKLIGNDQMISHWPARSGVLLDDGKLYFTAGMWSRDGVFIYCLDARDASVIWKNDTSGFHFATLPHSAGFAGVAPQGYLALHRNRIYVPTGRGAPACFDAQTGEFIFYENGHGYKPHQPGGSRVMAWRDWVIFKRRSQHKEEEVRYEERTPAQGAALGLYALNFRTGEPEWSLTDRNIVLARKNFLILGGAESVIKVDIADILEAYQQYWKDGKWIAYDENIRTSGVEYTSSAKGHLIPNPAWMSPLPFKKWEANVGRVFTMVQADNTILAGARNKLYAIDFNTGAILWEKKIDGDARGISVVDEKFIVSSTSGKLYCFGKGASDSSRTIRHKIVKPAIESDAVSLAKTILSETGVRAGYALMLGAGDGQLVRALVEKSDLTVYCLEPNDKNAANVRTMLDKTEFLGVRAAVHNGTFDELPYNPYFANLVLWGSELGSDVNTLNAEELYRVLRPYGGIACQLGTNPNTEKWLADAGVPSDEISNSFAGVEIKRGEIEGAGQWTHAYANIGRTSSSGDNVAKLPLGMLWWGGPGPARIVSRHWRAPVPLFSNGILYVQGQHDVFAVDAYNGREMWNRHLKDVGRFPPSHRGGNIVADENSVFCIQETRCLRLDAETGKTIQEYEYSLNDVHVEKTRELIANYKKTPSETRIVWEYLGLTGQYIIGTVANEAVVEMGQMPFGDAPQVGKYIFAFNKNSGKLLWDYCADRTVSPMAIVADSANLYLLDRTDDRLYQQTKRRGEIEFESSLKALDLATGNMLWEKPGIAASNMSLMLVEDTLVTYPNPSGPRQPAEAGGVAVYASLNGKLLWEKEILNGINDDRRGGNLRHTFAVGDTLYLPWAYDVHTGDERLLKTDPVTGDPKQFKLPGKNFCGTIAASDNLLTYRSASVGFAEPNQDSGSYWLPEVRPSCWISVLPAGGIVVAPEGYSTCICPYNYKTSVALMPVERNEEWSVYLDAERREAKAAAAKRARKGKARAASPPVLVQSLKANFNAPGDQMDSAGKLWMSYPRPIEGSSRYQVKDIPIAVEGEENRFRYNSDYHVIDGTSEPWLFTSGMEGPLKITVDLSDKKKYTYTVELMFAETEQVGLSGRVFDVKIQGKKMLGRFDIVREAGGANKACVRHFENVAAGGAMTIELVPVQGKAPRISSLAITREG